MRVLTLNLQHAAPARTAPDAGSAASRETLRRAGEEVAAVEADVVLLQEVDRGHPRSGGADQAAALAARLGMTHRFAASLAAGPGGLLLPARTSAVRRGYGVAILSRLPVLTWHVRPLRGSGLRRRPGTPWWSPRGWRVDPRRVLLAAVVRTEDGPLSVGSTHLSTVPDVARRQLVDAVTALRTLPGPHLLGGDLNLEPDALATPPAASDGGLVPLAHGLTFTNARPRRQLDHLLGDGLTAGPAQVHHLSVSDHAGLSVDVRPGGAADGGRMRPLITG